MKKLIPISLVCLLIDQIIKVVITTNLKIADSINIITNFFRITYLQNTGAAWSILSGNKIVLILITIIALFLIYYFLLKNKTLKNIEYILYGILIGGILGNLIDRIRFGYVIDYLDFNFGSYRYPVFNLADSAICIGVLFIIVIMIKESRIKKDERNCPIYKDGSIYIGDFINDKANGYGKYIFEDGEYYIGEWKNNLKHGKGIIYYKNGNICLHQVP